MVATSPTRRRLAAAGLKNSTWPYSDFAADDVVLEDDKWLTVNGLIRTYTRATNFTTKRKQLPKTSPPKQLTTAWPFTTTPRKFFEATTTREATMFFYPEIEFENPNSDFAFFDPNNNPMVGANSTLPLLTTPSWSATMSLGDTCHLSVGEMLAVVVMFLLTLSTVCMNVIVIILFLSNKHIRSLGNMYYMSLAFADLLIGSTAMPLNTYMQVMCDYWPFGSIACDLFISFDVLSSTASIMHLCVIAIDRYKVIDDPLGYVRRLSRKRVFFTIGCIWFAASAISFPGIAWWKAAGMAEHKTAFVDATDGTVYLECYLTHEVTYIFVSSSISFYIPLLAMSTVYYKIYKKAVAQSRFLTAGSKNVTASERRKQKGPVVPNGHNNRRYASKLADRITLRAHRGGQTVMSQLATQAAISASLRPTVTTSSLAPTPVTSVNSYSLRKDAISNAAVDNVPNCGANNINKQGSTTTMPPGTPPGQQRRSEAFRMLVRKSSMFSYNKSYTTYQKLKTIMSEHKAARTLGLIMGVFILCWLPFFVLNILSAIMPPEVTASMGFKTVFKIFTWCGYMNSVLNPFLYGVSNRTFRNIYTNFLTCGRGRKKQNRASGGRLSQQSVSGGSPSRNNVKTFRPATLPKEQQTSIEQSLRNPKMRDAAKQPQSPPPVLPLPKLNDIQPAFTSANKGQDCSLTRSLTLQFPERDIGHHSCYCQCADAGAPCQQKNNGCNCISATVANSSPQFGDCSKKVAVKSTAATRKTAQSESIGAEHQLLNNQCSIRRKVLTEHLFQNGKQESGEIAEPLNSPCNDGSPPVLFSLGYSPTSVAPKCSVTEQEHLSGGRVHSSLAPLSVPVSEQEHTFLLIDDDGGDDDVFGNNDVVAMTMVGEEREQQASQCSMCKAEFVEDNNSASNSHSLLDEPAEVVPKRSSVLI